MKNNINGLYKVHFFSGNESDFYDMCLSFHADQSATARYLRGKKSIDVQGLFDEFSAALQFPYYFGENWAAFDECLNDLYWCSTPKLALFLSEFNLVLQSDEKNKENFLKILQSTILEWQAKGVELHIFLHTEQEGAVALEYMKSFFDKIEVLSSEN